MKRTTKKVNIRFRRKDGTTKEIIADEITTEPVKIKFKKRIKNELE